MADFISFLFVAIVCIFLVLVVLAGVVVVVGAIMFVCMLVVNILTGIFKKSS